MTALDLKNSILQLAVQGKLVSQINTENSVDLHGLKQKKTDECEFDIPSSWKLAHLETITVGVPSKQYQILESEVKHSGLFPVISQSKAYSIGFTDNAEKLYHHENPVVIFGDHTTEIKYVDFDFVVGADGVKIFEPITSVLRAKFLYYVLQFYSKDLHKVGGYSRHYKFIKNKPIPLPPLDEQSRIVSKIEELLPFIEEYDTTEKLLTALNSEFPTKLRKSILQQAVQGKLTEQDSSDEPAIKLLERIRAEKAKLFAEGKIKKEKTIPVISEVDQPFDIPDTWIWTSIAETCTNIQYGTSEKSAPSGKVAVLRMGNLQGGKIDYSNLVYTSNDYDMERCHLEYNDLLFNRTNSKELVGKTAIYKAEIPAIYAGYLIRVTPILIDSDYLNYVMQSHFFKKYCLAVKIDAIGQSNINAEKLKRFVFPLPPLAEQKRIVERVEKLLAMCGALE